MFSVLLYANQMNDTIALDLLSDPRTGDKEKIISMVALGLGSFICGLVPYKCGRNSRRCPLTVSLMLCFGAGILLATALVHMLPDVRKTMPNNAEIALCGGFFIIYFIDEFIHYFFGEAIQHTHNSSEHPSHQRTNYGTNNNPETQGLLSSSSQHGHSHCNSEEVNARICHTSHTEPCTETLTGAIGLLIALSLHSFIEGLAIGVQDSGSRVLFLLGAVSAHKFVMAFCLGLEFCWNASSTLKSHIISIFVFSLGSVLGIGVGIGIVDLPDTWSKSALPILQAVAGGTLLYVTVSEVLPREKARWHQIPARRMAGLFQFVAVAFGFIVMTLIDSYLDDD